MLEVSPVWAFSDNYIRLTRTAGEPAGAAVVDPGDARPVQNVLDREGRELRSRDGPTLPSTIGLERRINPFLRCREPALRAAATAHAGRPVGTLEEVFAVVRSWNGGFR